jgi:catechol 2,3-dioxygenase-like lactoylglutathione lyase family enzyme
MTESLEIVGFSHIGFAVASIEEFRETWGAALGIKDWSIHDEAASGGINLHGHDSGELEVRVAYARLGGTPLELIETRLGRTHHLEHLERRGAGLHHIAFWVSDLRTELRKVDSLGLEIVMAPASLQAGLGNRHVSAVVTGADAGSVPVPEVFAFLDLGRGQTHFALELLDARFAADYQRLNGNMPLIPGDLTRL